MIGDRGIRRLLVFAAVIAPFTLLRFSFFGLGELVVLLVLIHQLQYPLEMAKLREFPLTRFWVFVLGAMLIGALVNQARPEPSSTPRGILFDLASYVFVLLTCYLLELLRSHRSLDVAVFARESFLASSAVLSALFVASWFTPSLFGLPLRYYHYFAPLANNLHQVSMSLVVLPFLGFVVMAREPRAGWKLTILVLILFDVAMALNAGSFKAILGLAVAGGAIVFSYTIRGGGALRTLLITLAWVLTTGLILDILNAGKLAMDLFVLNDPVGARQHLYSEALHTGLGTFLFGQGPGPHVYFRDGFWDVHQTHITLFIQGGLFALLAFLVLSFRLAVRSLYVPALLGGLATLLVYSAGGDILRRMPVWIMFFVIAHYPLKPPPHTPTSFPGAIR